MSGHRSWDDLVADLEAHPPGWFMRRYYALRRLPGNVRRQWRRFREFFVRGRRGWAESDTWGLDGYLARVMGEALEHLAENSHGYPLYTTADQWRAELRAHSAVLLAYDERAETGIAETMAWLGVHWGELWD